MHRINNVRKLAASVATFWFVSARLHPGTFPWIPLKTCGNDERR